MPGPKKHDLYRRKDGRGDTVEVVGFKPTESGKARMLLLRKEEGGRAFPMPQRTLTAHYERVEKQRVTTTVLGTGGVAHSFGSEGWNTIAPWSATASSPSASVTWTTGPHPRTDKGQFSTGDEEPGLWAAARDPWTLAGLALLVLLIAAIVVVTQVT